MFTKKTIAICWVGSIIIAGSICFYSGKKQVKVVEKVVAQEAKVVYRDRVITKTKYDKDGRIKEQTKIENKDVVKKDSSSTSTKTSDPTKDWAITIDGRLDKAGNVAIERRILGPISARVGVTGQLTEEGPKIAPFLGIRLEW